MRPDVLRRPKLRGSKEGSRQPGLHAEEDNDRGGIGVRVGLIFFAGWEKKASVGHWLKVEVGRVNQSGMA